MKYVEKAKEVLEIEIAGLRKVQEALDGGFTKAVELMLAALNQGGKIVVTGIGKSLHIGQKVAATFTSTGTPAVLLHPAEAMHGDLGILQPRDVLLAFSYSGESDEMINLLPVVKRSGVGIVAVTGAAESTLARHSDVTIVAAVEREACPFNLAPTTSTTAALAVGDALAMVLLDARGFNKEDYAKLHPGGAIGRALLLRVEDIMRTGARMAKVAGGAPVKDAVLAMTSARSGALAIVDPREKVLGIVTDGDLRRHLADATELADRKVDEIMTKNPVSIRKGKLAVDVLALFEHHNIDDIVVVDAKGRLAGMVDIQDLPKFKIF